MSTHYGMVTLWQPFFGKKKQIFTNLSLLVLGVFKVVITLSNQKQPQTPFLIPKYTKRTKVFQHLILSHTNNTKMGPFMKKVTSKRYGIQLIGFQIRIIRIQISHTLIFLINHSFLTFCNYQSVPPYATYIHFDHYT